MPILKQPHQVPAVPVASQLTDDNGKLAQEYVHFLRDLADFARDIRDIEVLARERTPFSQEVLDAIADALANLTSLYVKGTAQPLVTVEAVAPSSPAIELRDSATPADRWWLMSGVNTPTDGKFGIYDARQGLNRFVIDTAGDIGIGTTNPAYTLDTVGDVNITGTYRVNGVPLATGGGSAKYSVNGALIGQQPGLNLIAGTNITVSGANNTGASRVDVTITSSGTGGGGSQTPWTSNIDGAFYNLTDAGNITCVGKIGANVVSPAYPVDVSGDVNITGVYRINGVPLSTGGGAVSSVFTRTGAVVAVTGDYTAAQVTNAVDQTQSYANPVWLTTLAWSKITGAPTIYSDPLTTAGDIVYRSASATTRLGIGSAGQVLTVTSGLPAWVTPTAGAVTSVFTRTGAVVAAAGDYSAFYASLTGSYADPAWITSLNWSKLISVPTLVNSFKTRTGAITPATGDYTAAQVTNAVDSTQTYPNPAWLTTLAWSKVTGAPAFLTSLTPWTSNINGGGFNLTNVASVGLTKTYVETPSQLYQSNGNGVLVLQSHAGTTQDQPVQISVPDNTGAIAFFTSAGPVTPPTAPPYTERMRLTQNGALGIGLNNPAYLLHLNADSAGKPTTNTWTISSGAAVKKNIKPLRGGLEIIKKLEPVEAEYNGKGGTPDGQRVVSFIAEEIREVLPHTVTKDAEGNFGFNIHEVIHHLVLAVQQLSEQVSTLKEQHA